MSKAPAFQFYVKDFLTDVELQAASASSRGIWINALCLMWESRTRGEISGSEAVMPRRLNCTPDEFALFVAECKDLKFGDVTICNGEVTIRNRRMFNEEKAREDNRLRVRKHRSNATSNEKVTSLSSSSSSSAITKKVKDTPPPPFRGVTLPPAADRDFDAFWQEYPKKRSKGQAQKTWAKLRREKKLPPLPTILQAIAAAKAGHDWQKDGGQFIPHPSTWLNGHGWADEPSTAPAPSSRPGWQPPQPPQWDKNMFMGSCLDVGGNANG